MIPSNLRQDFITFGVVNSFYYTNHKGEREFRRMVPLCLRFGTTPYHKEAQWLLECFDPSKATTGFYRTLALKDVELLTSHEVRVENARDSAPNADTIKQQSGPTSKDSVSCKDEPQ